MFRLSLYLLIWLAVTGCGTLPPSTAASRQQEQADLVVDFQSWKSISFIKPDLSGLAGGLGVRSKTFTRDGVVKLIRNLQTPRGFVVVVLDRQYTPDPMVAQGGMDEIQDFFEWLGFRRIAFQDGSGTGRSDGLPILRDTTLKPRSVPRQTEPAAGA